MSAIYINRKQELRNIAKENFIAANKTYTDAHECLNNLVAIKTNYCDINSTEPLQRAINFPTMILKTDELKFNASALYFIRTIPTANKSLYEKLKWNIKHRFFKIKVPQPAIDETMYSWRNSARISAMFSNYNQAMSLLVARNTLSEQVKESIARIDPEKLTSAHLLKDSGPRIFGGTLT